MKALKHILIFLTLLIGFIVLLQAEEPRPPMRFPKYTSEIWRGGGYDATYPQEYRPDSGLYAEVGTIGDEPVGIRSVGTVDQSTLLQIWGVKPS